MVFFSCELTSAVTAARSKAPRALLNPVLFRAVVPLFVTISGQREIGQSLFSP